MEMSRLTRDGTAEPVSRDEILRRARGQGNVHFPCSAHHEQDWQPYSVDPYIYSAICDDHIGSKAHIYQQRTQLTIVTNIIEREFVATASILYFLVRGKIPVTGIRTHVTTCQKVTRLPTELPGRPAYKLLRSIIIELVGVLGYLLQPRLFVQV